MSALLILTWTTRCCKSKPDTKGLEPFDALAHRNVSLTKYGAVPTSKKKKKFANVAQSPFRNTQEALKLPAPVFRDVKD